jgi:hypothetical protein
LLPRIEARRYKKNDFSRQQLLGDGTAQFSSVESGKHGEIRAKQEEEQERT